MSKKSELLKIAKELEEKFISLDVDDPSVTKLFAVAKSTFEKVASSYEDEFGAEDLTILSVLASAFDNTGDTELQKEAADIDQVLFAIANPKLALARLNEVYDEELNQLRMNERRKDREDKYSAKDKLHEMHGNKAIADAVKDQVRRYRPMEAALSTRYSPDRPGVSLMRITDNVYQDPTTGKIYNYESGYKTDKGNEVPGTSVQNQSNLLQNETHSIFTTRENLLSSASDTRVKKAESYASEERDDFQRQEIEYNAMDWIKGHCSLTDCTFEEAINKAIEKFNLDSDKFIKIVEINKEGIGLGIKDFKDKLDFYRN